MYAALAARSFFPQSDLANFRQLQSHLQGHPKLSTPGVDASTGPLGLGASIAAGLAFAGNAFRRFNVYALLSDGELDAGILWEAALFASHHRLSNLTFIIDRNGRQFTGRTEAVVRLEPLREKWRSFLWDVTDVDGHDPVAVVEALTRSRSEAPRVVIAHTVKGKGVSFMEDQGDWHGRVPNTAEYEAAKTEIVDRMNRRAA